MKFLLCISLFVSSALAQPTWLNDVSLAKKQAVTEHKLLLINFSGSDWCGPCIRMHKTIFNDPSFVDFAAENLVLVNADFPRLKKNQLSKEQEKRNGLLADQYNAEGKFPFTVLANAEGKVLKSWEGCPDESATAFVAEVNQIAHENR